MADQTVTGVDPGRLVDLLVDAGWTVAGHRTGAYMRLKWDDRQGTHLLVPLDVIAPEYTDLMRNVMYELRRMSMLGNAAREVLDGVCGRDIVDDDSEGVQA